MTPQHTQVRKGKVDSSQRWCCLQRAIQEVFVLWIFSGSSRHFVKHGNCPLMAIFNASFVADYFEVDCFLESNHSKVFCWLLCRSDFFLKKRQRTLNAFSGASRPRFSKNNPKTHPCLIAPSNRVSAGIHIVFYWSLRRLLYPCWVPHVWLFFIFLIVYYSNRRLARRLLILAW